MFDFIRRIINYQFPCWLPTDNYTIRIKRRYRSGWILWEQIREEMDLNSASARTRWRPVVRRRYRSVTPIQTLKPPHWWPEDPHYIIADFELYP